MKIYNTLTGQKEDFVPVEPGKVKMYVCGPTVYNLIHIGNARPMIIFDTVKRYLEYKGYDVTYVSNFTDIDDKIIKKAIEEGVPSEEISTRYIEECLKDMDGMNTVSYTHLDVYKRQYYFVDADNPVKSVNNVSMNIRRGKITAIIGESGSGKSTIAMSVPVSYTHLPTIIPA